MKKIKVLYEDSNILAIDKPSGISVHPSAPLRASANGKKEKFITDWVLKNYPKNYPKSYPQVSLWIFVGIKKREAVAFWFD